VGNTPKIKRRKDTKKPQQAAGAIGAPWLRRVGIGVGVAAVLGFAVFMALGDPPIPDGAPEGTREVDVAGAQHVDGDIHDETDGETPAGGDHNAVWLNCGVYDETVDSEFAVHSLEHGAVWITYGSSLDGAGVDTLRGVASSRAKVIVSPVPNQQPPVRATAWGYQLDLEDPGDLRLRQFVSEFEGSPNAPEPGGLCTGGTGQPS
jgi:hypothetical protein